ncbi:competence CoiA-like family protein [Salmonella enterica subsp. enterica serovar Barranquilla]|nr:competence CoiA-like family protein [Salmonella enterica subsp. enterica serovar Barranquilla]EHR7215951.1 competence CoiA-like family protein [Salmonella enterica]EDV6642487.1 competence CoiA-like family protein [Salmonella enterica subsp. enterica serovar Barranquilla]EGX7327999.1 competence CoiA-like family protein [Salmonella enterica subsp. enterica serovar Barranquilla]EID4447845.1 competence CoiA-like family protein [Salmonella enterica]
MNDTVIKIPWAKSVDEKLIHIHDAVKGQKYYCPCCNEQLTFKEGKIKKRHFSHRSDTQCDPESVYHKLAKILICYAVYENSRGNRKITLISKCFGCHGENIKTIPPHFFSSSHEEVSIDNYRCDVVADTQNSRKIAIEIYHTHETDENKKEKLSIPWIELKSETVIENPFLWRCHDFRFRLGFCKDCINHFMDVIRLCDKHKIDRNLYTPLNIPNDKKHNYIADIITCYRCKKNTPVFIHNNGPTDKAPHTICFVRTPKVKKGYLSNTCVHCEAIIGIRYINWETTHIKYLNDFEYTLEYKWFGSKLSKQKELDILRGKLMNISHK